MSSVYVTSGSQFRGYGFGDALSDVASWGLTSPTPDTTGGSVDQAQAATIGAAVNAFIDQMNAAKAQVSSLNALLYSSVSQMSSFSLTNAKASAQSLLNVWHTNAVNWMNETTGIVIDIQNDLAAGDLTIATDEVNNWIQSGQLLIDNAVTILNYAGALQAAGSLTDNFGPALQQVWQGALNAAAYAGTSTVQAAGSVLSAAGSAAGGALLSTLTPVLLAVAGIAAVLYLLDQSSGGRAAVSVGERAALAGLSEDEYLEAKRTGEAIEAAARRAKEKLDAFPRGAMNLTPDHVKALPEWRQARQEMDQAFAALRKHNAAFVKKFKREIAEDRKRRGR